MVFYEKHEYCLNKKIQNYEINGILWRIRQIMQHVLKYQQVYLLPKFIKLMYRGVFLHVFAHASTGHPKINVLILFVLPVFFCLE